MNQQIFYVNSRHKINDEDTHSDFYYEIQIDQTKNFNRVAVLDLSIPKTYFNLPSGYTTFTVLEPDPRIITILPGNYSKNTLKIVLASVLNDAAPVGWIYNISTSSSTQGDNGRYTFSVSGNSGVQPIFVFDIDSPWEQLGFENNSYVFDSDVLTSINVINLNAETTLFVHSTICQDQNNNILQSVYTSGSPSYSYITWTNMNVERNSNVFRFYLSDENDRGIDLQGNNMVFCLILFEENNGLDMVKQYIKYKLLSE